MLEIFRKYQRYLFLLITVVIIISFSFFGTYSTLGTNSYHEQVAFTAIDGTPIKRSELDQMTLFISTDADDKLLFGGLWGPNFLNDGVVKKDFLQTGLAQLLAAQYASDINQDLASRLEKEKRFVPYEHPQAHFLSVETIWNYMAPGMKSDFETIRSSTNPVDPEAFNARVNLYLGERKLSAPMLRQILSYQQKQYSWLTPDPNLDRTDLSLYGYHTLDDWFGPRFMRLIAEFIINSAKIAEKQGYSITRAEAIADLMQNSDVSFKQNLSNPNLGVANGNEYFTEQLHRMGLDPNKAADLWMQVMLFRRLFHDMGHSVFVDPLAFSKINSYTLESIEGNVYRLPQDLRLSSFKDMQLFETYLNAISKRPEDEKGLLTPPNKFYSVAEVAKKTPQLVQKRYLLDVAQVDKNLLTAKVSIKETWKWESEPQNWDKLKLQFPELASKKAETPESRLAALDGLDDKARAKVDAYARKEIVNAHPEWLEKALQETSAHRLTVSLKLKGGTTPFAGLEKNEDLMRLLDKAKLAEQDPTLTQYSADNNTFYRIVVLDRSPAQEILTFAEAKKDGSLEGLFEIESKGALSDAYFDKLLNAIRNDYAAGIAPEKAPVQIINDVAASLRFFAYDRDALNQIKKDPAKADLFVRPVVEQGPEDKLSAREALSDQWKLGKATYHSNRANEGKDVDLKGAYALKEGSWSKVYTPVNGDLYFFQLTKKGSEADVAALDEKVHTAQQLLSDEAQRILMKHLLREMKEKHSLSLDYLNHSAEMEPEEQT